MAQAVRVHHWVGHRGSCASGLILATDRSGRALVLTASHVVEGDLGILIVQLPDGRLFSASLLARDPIGDQAALWIPDPGHVQPITLCREQPEKARFLTMRAGIPLAYAGELLKEPLV